MAETAANSRRNALAMMALNAAELPALDDVVARATALFGDDLALEPDETKDGTLMFRLGDGLAFVSLIPAQIPMGDLERPIASAWWWPDAAQAMEAHQAHLLVGTFGQSCDAIDTRLLLTRLIAVMIELTDVAGIYWGDGSLVHDPAVFRRLAGDVSRQHVPTALWVNIQVGPDLQAEQTGKPGLFAGYTLGLEALGQPEVQTRQASIDGEQMFQTIHDFAHYLIVADPQIADGDTIGASEHERILVRYRPNVWEPSKQAYELFFPQAHEATKPLK